MNFSKYMDLKIYYNINIVKVKLKHNSFFNNFKTILLLPLIRKIKFLLINGVKRNKIIIKCKGIHNWKIIIIIIMRISFNKKYLKYQKEILIFNYFSQNNR